MDKTKKATDSFKKESGSFVNPLALDNCVAMLFGRRGSGKTTLAFKLIRKFKKIIIYDPRNQINEKGFVQCQNFDEFVKAILESPNSYKIIYKPRFYQHDFPYICKYLEEIPLTDVMFMVDEVAMICDTYNIDPSFHDIIRAGRHKKIGLVMTAQRPKDVNRNLTAECNHIFTFTQHEPTDLAYMRGFMGKDADPILSLPEYSFLYWDTKQTKIVDKDKSIVVA